MAKPVKLLITSDRYGEPDTDYTMEREVIADFPDLDVTLVGNPASSEQDLIDRSAGMDALLVSTREAITPHVLASIPSVKVISRYGVGLDNVDLDSATENGIVVTHYPGYCTDEVADHAMALILALNRRIVQLDRDLHHGAWGKFRATTTNILRGPVRPLRELTLGIVGFGRIGQTVARRAAPFGLRIIAADPYIDPQVFGDARVAGVALDDLLRQADIVTIHTPLTKETRGMIDAAKLALMQRDAVIVNTARGPIIDLAALAAALRNNQLAGAGLDVVDPEPLPEESPLYAFPNVILTPHAAYYSERSIVTVRTETMREALNVLRGHRPRTVANPEVLKKVALVSEDSE